MAVMKGYKQTDLGVIPQDWDVVPMGQVGDCLIGLTYSPRDVRDFGTLVLRSSNVQNGRLAFDDNIFVDMEIPARAITRKNDILICVRNGSRQLIGKCALIDDKTADSAFGAFMSVLRSDSAKFLFFQFQSNIQKHQINEVMGATINQITNKNMAAFKVIWPPTKAEQQAIAGALSDADALIESLEQLIAKKRHLKQGTMQELLTGKKRLPGFRGGRLINSKIGQIPCDWRMVEIGKIASVKTGPFGSSLHERDYVDDGTPIITVEHLGERGVVHNNLPMVSNADRKRLSAYSLEEGDIVFSRVGSVDRNARVSNREQGWLFSGRLLRLRRIEDSVDTQFLSYQFHFEPFKQRVRTVAVGQTMASLNTQILKGVLIVLPPPSEQTAIATILSDMDTEIAALETQLAKTRSLKQGMMHNLLTGKVRLV